MSNKKYAIVKKKVFGYSFGYTYVAYEYTLMFRLFGARNCMSISESYTSESADKCEALLRERLAAEDTLYETVRIINV